MQPSSDTLSKSPAFGVIIVGDEGEATLTPLMQAIERDHAGVKVFSLPSVDHPQYGRHIDLGVSGCAIGCPDLPG